MCGFAGLFLPKEAELIEPNINDMLGAITHRGPDGNGYYVSDDRRVYLGFVRLAIIDLDTGDQPFRDSLTGTVMVGNGEIYNYHELRSDPRVSDFAFQSKGDMEAAFALALRTGKKFVSDLRGMFALALVENNQQRFTVTPTHSRKFIQPVLLNLLSCQTPEDFWCSVLRCIAFDLVITKTALADMCNMLLAELHRSTSTSQLIGDTENV